MFTAGAKLWYAVTGFALVAAVVYFVSTGGEELGTFVLAAAAVGAAVIASAALAVRDGAVPARAGDEPVREVPRVEALPAVWPVLGAVGVAISIVGLAGGNALLWVGVAVLLVTLVEWMVQGWAERSTADPTANRALRNRIMFPLEIPALAVIGVALVILTVSRVLLALPKNGSVAIAIVLAVIILAVASVLANRPNLSSSVLAGAVAIGAVLLIAGGIVGGIAGEREFEHHGTEAHAEDEEGDAPTEAGDDEEGTPTEAGDDEGTGDDADPERDADRVEEVDPPAQAGTDGADETTTDSAP